MPRVEGGLVGVGVVVVVTNTDVWEGELAHGIVHGEGLFTRQVVTLGLA